jgi:hypothetical protein
MPLLSCVIPFWGSRCSRFGSIERESLMTLFWRYECEYHCDAGGYDHRPCLWHLWLFARYLETPDRDTGHGTPAGPVIVERDGESMFHLSFYVRSP